MNFKIRLPARINVLGNPSDANEGDYRTISAAINLYGEATFEESDVLSFETLNDDGKVVSHLKISSDSDLKYGGEFDLFKAAVNILSRYSAEFRAVRSKRSPRISFRTEIPRQSGLGGSTVLLLLALAGMVEFYGLDRRKHNKYVLAELAQRAEEKELGITCGFADRYVPLFGDIAYIDYRDKLFHMPIFEEPFATYEKLGAFVDEFPIVLVYTGVEHDSGDVHGRMRKIYLDEFSRYRPDLGKAPTCVDIMKLIGDTAWKGKAALLEADWPKFGSLMNENHRLIDDMMRYCGFESGAGEINNLVIKAALDAGALGAKLTGAGGGGSVFILARPGGESEMAASTREILEQNGCSDGKVFSPSIDRNGLTNLKR